MKQIQKLVPAAPKNGMIPVVNKKIDQNNKYDVPIDIMKKDITLLDFVLFSQYKKKELKLANYKENEIKATYEDYPMKTYQPLQFTMHASVRYLKKNFTDCVVGVTPHFIIFFQTVQDLEGRRKPEFNKNIHVMEIKKLFHGISYEKIPFLQIRLISQMIKGKKTKLSATFATSDTEQGYELIQKLTRIVYRNVSLAYANLDDENVNLRPKLSFDPNLYSDQNKNDAKQQHKSSFPSFDEFIAKKLSPSQRFQFTYAANCSHDWIPYDHRIVENFHDQVINSNGVLNAGYIHFQSNDEIDRSLYEMIPVFRSLIYTHSIQGVVCANTKQPDILKAVSYQLIKSSNLKFLHLSNVQASEGLNDLYNNISCNTESCGVIYFDFSGNPFLQKEILIQNKDSNSDTPDSFFDIFREYKSKVIYISFNDCNLKTKHLNALFTAMKNYPSLGKLKYLHISKSQLYEKPRSLFKDYLAAHQNLVSLDIGNMFSEQKDSGDSNSANEVDIEDIIKALSHQPLERLYLYKNAISDKCFESLKNLIDICPMLSVLDISDTGLNVDQVSRIVDTMSSRLNSRMLTIKASNLKLSGKTATLTMAKGFLNGQLDRWETIYLDSNDLRPFDLQILVPLFQQMINLRELSLSDNFDNDMPGIEYELCNLLRIPGLKILRLGGPSSQNRVLGNKIMPFLFSVALSYQLRSKIGGLAMKNREKEQKEFAEGANESIIPKLDLKEEEVDGYKVYLQKKFDHIMRPFLLEKKKEEAAEFFKTDQGNENWRQMFREMIPLINKCRGIYSYEKNEVRKKTIADRTMDILTQWTTKIPITSKTSSMENEIIKACSAEDKKQWIDMAANLAHLKYLDLKEVKIDLNLITTLLKIDRELRGIEIDGCDIKTVGSVVDFVNTIEEQPNLIKIPFPNKDMEKLIKETRKTCKEAGEVVKRDMEKLKNRLSHAISKHRFILSDKSMDEDDIPEYPYETIPEIQKLLQEKRSQKRNLRSHSGICEDFGMQLPYISMDNGNFTGLPDDYYLEDDEIINRMSVYEFETCTADPRFAEKSIAIQKRFDEIDLFNIDSNSSSSSDVEDDEDDTDVWNKTTQNVHENWDLFQTDKMDVVLHNSEDNSDSDTEDDDPDYVPPPFESGKNSKKKFYKRPKKDIILESDSDPFDDFRTFNRNHASLQPKLTIKGSDYKYQTLKSETEIEEPPDV